MDMRVVTSLTGGRALRSAVVQAQEHANYLVLGIYRADRGVGHGLSAPPASPAQQQVPG